MQCSSNNGPAVISAQLRTIKITHVHHIKDSLDYSLSIFYIPYSRLHQCTHKVSYVQAAYRNRAVFIKIAAEVTEPFEPNKFLYEVISPSPTPPPPPQSCLFTVISTANRQDNYLSEEKETLIELKDIRDSGV